MESQQHALACLAAPTKEFAAGCGMSFPVVLIGELSAEDEGEPVLWVYYTASLIAPVGYERCCVYITHVLTSDS